MPHVTGESGPVQSTPASARALPCATDHQRANDKHPYARCAEELRGFKQEGGIPRVGGRASEKQTKQSEQRRDDTDSLRDPTDHNPDCLHRVHATADVTAVTNTIARPNRAIRSTE